MQINCEFFVYFSCFILHNSESISKNELFVANLKHPFFSSSVTVNIRTDKNTMCWYYYFIDHSIIKTKLSQYNKYLLQHTFLRILKCSPGNK